MRIAATPTAIKYISEDQVTSSILLHFCGLKSHIPLPHQHVLQAFMRLRRFGRLPIPHFGEINTKIFVVVVRANVVRRACLDLGKDRVDDGDEVPAWFDEGRHLLSPVLTHRGCDCDEEPDRQEVEEGLLPSVCYFGKICEMNLRVVDDDVEAIVGFDFIFEEIGRDKLSFVDDILRLLAQCSVMGHVCRWV